MSNNNTADIRAIALMHVQTNKTAKALRDNKGFASEARGRHYPSGLISE
jgi:hypothetical protein